ncbi:MAG: hypothetical protein ACF8XB_25285 [Planctomycetota bacterium JB042]
MGWISVFLLLLLAALGCAGLLFVLSGRRRPSPAPRPAGPHPVLTLLGAVLVGAVLAAELGAFSSRGPDALPVRIVDAEPGAPFDRAQVLTVETLPGGFVRPGGIRVATAPLAAGDLGLEVDLDGLGSTLELTWSSEERFEELSYSVRTLSGNHFWTLHGSRLGRRIVDVGDGAPFRSIGFGNPVGPGLRLRDVDDARFSIWIRRVPAGASLETVPRERVEAAAATAVGEAAIAAGPSSRTRPYGDGPAKRLLQELAPIGTLLFVAGLALLLRGRVGLVRGAALVALLLVVTAGTASRMERARAAEALGSDDPAARHVALVRLARSMAAPTSGAETLARVFADERDPRVKARLLLLTVDEKTPLHTLPAARRMRDEAARSDDETLRALAEVIASSDRR